MRDTDELRPQTGDALLVVDVQNDFLPGGALGVTEGDRILEPVRRAIEAFRQADLPVYATRDRHPPHHCSFREAGGAWPAHCVFGTPGAQLSAALEPHQFNAIIDKGMRADRDAYSGFEGTDLARRLQQHGVSRIFVAGLATDYCVLHTVLDALAEGLQVVLLTDAIAAVNLRPYDGRDAVRRMLAAGAMRARVTDLTPCLPRTACC